jgi:hypothetical protein
LGISYRLPELPLVPVALQKAVFCFPGSVKRLAAKRILLRIFTPYFAKHEYSGRLFIK